MVSLLALYSIGGLLLAGISVPLVLHKIPPRWFYGKRLQPTPENLLRWYKGTKYLGRRFLAVGLGTAIGASILYYPILPNVEEYAMSCLGLFLAFFLWGVISSFLYLRAK